MACRSLGVFAALAMLAPAAAWAQASPSAYTTGYRYDAAGRQTGVILPDPDGAGAIKYAATRNTYDTAGRLTKIETGELASWQSESVAPASWSGFTIFQTTDITYDAMSRKVLETVSSGGTRYTQSAYSYDSKGRPECSTVRLNSATFASPPVSACTLATTGSFGPDRITRNLYDVVSQLTTVQRAYGTALQQNYATYTYSNDGKQASVTDANGNKASMTYDGFDRQSAWNFPSPTTPGTVSATDYETYAYDNNSNRTSWRKRDGRTFAFSYDALDRMTVKTVPDGGCTTPYTCTAPPASATRDVYYGYDLRGLQLNARFDSAAGADGVATAYDGFGRIVTSTVAMGGVSRSLAYQYDRDGSRTRVTHPDGNYWVYGYDGLDRLTAIGTNGTAGVAAIAYDTQGRRQSLTRGGVTSAYGYDPVSRLSSLADDLASTPNDVSWGFTYNPASQVASRTLSNDSYAYLYHNRSQAYVANGLNQYASVAGAAYGYDSSGNLTGDPGSATNSAGAVTLGYDAENRLISASGARSAALTYDPLGRLFQMAGAATTTFLYDGDALVEEYSAAGVLQQRTVHGAGDDDPLLFYTGSAVTTGALRSYQTDAQGSIVSVADGSGAGLSINAYDDWGRLSASTPPRFGYTGQLWLGDVGLYHYKARVYSPAIGRFLQTDPTGYDDQVNLYAYVGNDPGNGSDPTGMFRGDEEPDSCTGSRLCAGSIGVAPGVSGSCSGNCEGAAQAAPSKGKTGSVGNRDRSQNGDATIFENRGGQRGGQQQGDPGRTARPDGSGNPDKKFKPGLKPGTRIFNDPTTGKPVTKPWPEDGRRGGDGTGVHPGSKYPDGTPVNPGGNKSAMIVGGLLGLGAFACAVVEPCGAAVATALGLGGAVSLVSQ